ncbi:MAG: putative selenoprotein, partial [Verrucomicrobiaceae bacterium]
RKAHPETPPMDYATFFRNRQDARYGSRGGGRCC